MSKRLAFAVATAAELSVAGEAISKSNSQATPLSTPRTSTVTAASTRREEQKQQLDDDFSPAPPVDDSDDDDAPPAHTASSRHALPVPAADPRYLSEQELLNLQPLPVKSPRTTVASSKADVYEDDASTRPLHSSESARPGTASSSFRHRTSLYVDSRDGLPVEVFCSAFSSDSRYLAVGCGDGTTRVYNSAGQLRHLFQPRGAEPLPVTCVRFRPATAAAFSSLIHVLLVASADGSVAHYHLSSPSNEPASLLPPCAAQLYAAAYAASALSYATAGRDATVRLYDEQTRKHTTTLPPLDRYGGATATSGHSNRVYAVKYSPVDDNMLFSAGWDNTVQVWDVRAARAVRSLYGPHVCGDALDVSADGERLLSASWRQSDCLQVWDWSRGALVDSVVYNAGSEAGGGGKAEMLYAAGWSADGQWLVAGGCGSNDAKVRRATAEGGWEERISLKGGVYSVAISPDSKRVAVAGADANLIIVDL